jgi:thioredoxin-related protein
MKAIKVAMVFVIALLIIWLFIGVLKSKKEERDLLSWIRISVIHIDNSIPPGLMIEVRNNGPRTVGTTHFRLVFKADGKDFCSVHEDDGNFGPNEKRRILLKASAIYKDAYFSSGTRIHYFLQAFPEYKKGLDVIEGEFFLK